MLELVGVSRVTQWRMEREGLFPARVRVGKSSVGWHLDEVEEWLKGRERVPATLKKAPPADAHRESAANTESAVADPVWTP